MCLKTVEQVFLEPKDEDWKVGYKCFYFNEQHNILQTAFIGEPVYEGAINKDKYTTILTIHRWDNIFMNNIVAAYPTGFHIWENLQDAKDYSDNRHRVYKVLYRKVTAIGMNTIRSGLKNKVGNCIVAKEMMIDEYICD